MGRSQSESNLPVSFKDYEDIRKTWKSKSKKRPTLMGSVIHRFDGVKAFTPKEVKVREQDVVTLEAAQFLESEDFELCGYTWSLRVYPIGVDEHSEHLAVKLQNKSEASINAYYSISLKRSEDPDDDLRLQMWVEPELDKLMFRQFGHPDSCWGVDDLLPLDVLYDPQWRYMDLENDILYVELSMEVYGDDTLASHPLKKAIEKGASEDALIDIADEDMTTIKNALKGGGASLKSITEHQDRLVHIVLPPSGEMTEDEKREKDRQDREATAAMELTSVIRTVSLSQEESAEEGKGNGEEKTKQ